MNKLVKPNKTETLEEYLMPRLKEAKLFIDNHTKEQYQLEKKWNDFYEKDNSNLSFGQQLKKRSEFEEDLKCNFFGNDQNYDCGKFLQPLFEIMIDKDDYDVGENYMTPGHLITKRLMFGSRVFREVTIYQHFGRYKSSIDSFIQRENNFPVLNDKQKKEYLGFITMKKNVDKIDEEKRIFPRILYMLMVEFISKHSLVMYSWIGCIPKPEADYLKFTRYDRVGSGYKEVGVDQWKPFGKKHKMDDEVFADLKSIMKVFNEL